MIYKFEELTPNQLYAILRLRQNVFVLEQKSFCDDIDNKDQLAHHFCLFSDQQQLLAYARLRIIKDVTIVGKIERVVVDRHVRGQHLAVNMMDVILKFLRDKSEIQEVVLSAQMDVVTFYAKWGFVVRGSSYDDGGIEHVDMYLSF